MGVLPTKPFCLLSLFLIFHFNLDLIPLSESASDYSTLVYKGCAKQELSDPTGVYSQAISTLYGSLISQSSNAKFFKTTTGSGQTTITGLFQCRGDLSNVDCYNCVSQLPILIDKLCTGQPIAARIQLMGCYMLYEIAGFTQVSGMEMLYKTCSGQTKQGSGFEEKRDTALSPLENGIGSSGNGGFYTTSYDSVYVWGQCEGDLGGADCGDCVRSAVQRSQVECGSSVSPHNHQVVEVCLISARGLRRTSALFKLQCMLLGGLIPTTNTAAGLMFLELQKQFGKQSFRLWSTTQSQTSKIWHFMLKFTAESPSSSGKDSRGQQLLF